MKVLVDLNLPPAWVGFLAERGIEAVHWSEVGDLRASDAHIMEWSRENGCIVFTHDLDYSALLAATHARGPSVLQVRTHDVLPSAIGEIVIQGIRQRAAELEKGAILTIDLLGARVRFLPIEPRQAR